jgi:hypothetical protein
VDQAARSGPRWTEQRHGLSHGGASLAQGAPGVTGLQSSPAAEAGEGGGDEAVPMRGSLGHNRQWRSDEEVQRWLEFGVSMEEGGRELRNEGKRCGGGAHPFIGAKGRLGGGGRAVTIGNNGG